MSEPEYTIEIDSLILSDLDLTPERAAHIRRLTERELGRLLREERWPPGAASRSLRAVEAPEIALTGTESDHALAGSLARNIVRGLRGAM